MGDPSDPLSLNRYVYCNLDPVNFVDPTGFKTFGVTYGVGGCIFIGGKIEMSFVWDDQGNYGLLYTTGFSVGTQGEIKGFDNLAKLFSVGTSGFYIPGADSIFDLAGSGGEFSGSVFIGNMEVDQDGNYSFEVGNIGIGASYTWTDSYLIVLSDLASLKDDSGFPDLFVH